MTKNHFNFFWCQSGLWSGAAERTNLCHCNLVVFIESTFTDLRDATKHATWCPSLLYDDEHHISKVDQELFIPFRSLFQLLLLFTNINFSQKGSSSSSSGNEAVSASIPSCFANKKSCNAQKALVYLKNFGLKKELSCREYQWDWKFRQMEAWHERSIAVLLVPF